MSVLLNVTSSSDRICNDNDNDVGDDSMIKIATLY
jgi:hypothetical protein